MSVSPSILSLILLNLVVAAYCVYRHCVRRGRIVVNHVTLFSMGFVLYWILPIAVGALGFFRGEPVLASWYELYDEVPQAKILLYLSICMIAYVAFVAGSSLAGKPAVPPSRRIGLFAFDGKLADLYLVFALLAIAAFAVILRDEFFRGYLGRYDETYGWRGSFTAASLPLLSLAFIYTAKLEQRTPAFPKFGRLAANRFFFAYFIVAILALSMGGRLYFLSSILMLLVYRTVFFRGITASSSLMFFVALALMAGLTEAYRSGLNVAPGAMTINLFIEFLFTGFSVIHFLRDVPLELVKFPVFLASDFINLVPTFLFTGKTEALLRPEAYGYIVFSPGGALCSFFSFMINFGVLGTWFVLFVFGFCLNSLRGKEHVLLAKVMYVMLSGWLAFTFFRDPFSVSIVKCMFEFSVLVPTLAVVSMHLLTFSVRAYEIVCVAESTN